MSDAEIRIPKTVIKRILTEYVGKNKKVRFSNEAVEKLIDYLEDIGVDIANDAIRLAKHAGRTTITLDDIKMVLR